MNTHRIPKLRRRGMALVLVLSVIALAAIMGFAMLSSSQVQVDLVHNNTLMAQAEYVAEAGFNVATTYIQNPEKTPTTPVDISTGFLYGNGPWSFSVSLGTLPSGVTGSAVVTVAKTTTANVYSITSAATAVAGNDSLTRTLQGNVRTKSYGSVQSLDLNTDLSLTNLAVLAITGNVRTTGVVSLKASATLSSGTTIAAASVSPATFSGSLIAAPTSAPVPAPATIRDYRTYRYLGKTYSATKLSGTTINSTDSFGPTGSNPAGVYWTDQSLALNAGANFVGTLVVQNGGSLSINGAGVTLTSSASNFPTLVVDGDIISNGPNTGASIIPWLTVNGMTYAGGGITTGRAKKTALTFNGPIALGTGTFDSTYQGTLVLNYNAANPFNAPVTDFQPAVTILSYSWQ